MATYTVFLDELEEHARHFGLTAEQACKLILDRAKLTYEWERRDDAYWVVLRHRHPRPRPLNWPAHVAWGEPQEFASTVKSDEAAREELRKLIFSGVVQSWRALPDDAFLALQQWITAKMEADMREYEAVEQQMEERMQTAGASYLRLVN